MIPIGLGLGGPYDIAIIAGVVLLLFGGSKLAGFGKSVGFSIKEFKSAVKDDDNVASDSPASSVSKQDNVSSPAHS